MNHRLLTSLIILSFLSACGERSNGQGVGIGKPIDSVQSQPITKPTPAKTQPSGNGSTTREALFACTREAGITGGFSTTFTMANGVQRRVVNPSENVTKVQAAAANACLGNT